MPSHRRRNSRLRIRFSVKVGGDVGLFLVQPPVRSARRFFEPIQRWSHSRGRKDKSSEESLTGTLAILELAVEQAVRTAVR